jgi:hypothetical protein
VNLKTLEMKTYSFLFLATLFAPIFCATPKFDGCDTEQVDGVKVALEDVQLLSKAAARESEGGRGKFHDWFGKGGVIKDETINIRYEKFSNILTAVPKGEVTFDCTMKNACCYAGLS